jgi:hypothetical protein
MPEATGTTRVDNSVDTGPEMGTVIRVLRMPDA